MENKNIDKKSLIKETLYALIAGVIGIVFVSIFTHNWNFISLIKSFNPYFLGTAFILMFADWVIEAYVLKLIAGMLGYKVPISDALNIFLIGGFFSRITPFSGGGGEPFQIYLLSRDNKVKPGDSTAIVAIKTFIGTFTRISIFLLLPLWIALAKPHWRLSHNVNMLINVGIAITMIFFALFIFAIIKPEIVEKWIERISRRPFFRRIIPKNKLEESIAQMRKIVDDFEKARNKIFTGEKITVIYTFVLSFISWGLVLFTPVLLMRGLGIMSPWPEIVITALIFYIASAYIPTPGGSGTAEVGILALFAGLIPQPLIGVFVIMWRVFTHYSLIIFGGILTFKNFRKKKNPEDQKKNED
jgi:uncharacterized protein (TIRG00374 family)